MCSIFEYYIRDVFRVRNFLNSMVIGNSGLVLLLLFLVE